MAHFRLAGCGLLALSACFVSSSVSLSAQAGLSPNVEKQMKDIYTFKASLTPVEEKMSTNLVLLSRQAQGKLAPNMVRYAHALNRGADGKFAVDVRGYKTSAFVDSIAKVGADMTEGSTSLSAVRTGQFHARIN